MAIQASDIIAALASTGTWGPGATDGTAGGPHAGKIAPKAMATPTYRFMKSAYRRIGLLGHNNNHAGIDALHAMAPPMPDTFDTTDPAFVAMIDELPLWSAPFGLALLDTVRYRRGLRVLDIGSGLSFPAVELAGRLGSSSEVHGVDPWPTALARARDKASAAGLRNLALHEAACEQLPFEDASFDLLVSNNGLNNVRDLTRCLAECARVMRSGAQLVATMNLEGTMRELYDVLREIFRAHGVEESRIDRHIAAKRPPLPHVLGALEQAGFAIVSAMEDSFQISYADGAAMMNHFLIRLAFLPAWSELVDDETRGPIFEALETRLNEIAAEQGVLMLTVPFVTIDAVRR